MVAQQVSRQAQQIGKIEHARGFALSLAYVLGMAVTYAAAGVAAGMTGTLLSAALQNAWVLGGFALVFVVLSFSMFGFYELQLPTALQSKLSEESGHLRGGRGIGVFAIQSGSDCEAGSRDSSRSKAVVPVRGKLKK